ncbi:type II toxin-antitoxin system RelE/ParE family toxin [Undibacterium danionis]|uniref:Toxin n=1 Tax=Undibacterium danionis TaxID=1812100 RepID=A0ABV6IFK8_9BURK
MTAFQLSKEAKNDLRSIAIFTEKRWGKVQRNLYIKQLDDAFLTLAHNPNLGISCDYIRDSYRKFPQGSHIIFYKCDVNSTILIVRILHKSMDYDSQF